MEYLRDPFVAALLHVFVFLVFLIASVNDLRARYSTRWSAHVIRGDKSLAYFPVAFALLSAPLLQILEFTEGLRGYKTLAAILDLAIIARLCFYSPWFRNAIVTVAGGWAKGEEPHG